MVQNIKRHPKRSDEEWINLIKECRNSGLSDKAWCELHNIYPSNLYYHIRRLRNHICNLPESSCHMKKSPEQEIVQVQLAPEFLVQNPNSATMSTLPGNSSSTPALRINIGGCKVEIFNNAASETIYNTLTVLQRLC